VIIAAEGYILTSTTAVPPGATAVEIYFADHSRATAEIVETRAEVEAVLLKVARTGLPFLPLTAQTPVVGMAAYTTGNANNMLKLGDGASFSAGVISAIYEIDNADAQSAYRGQVLETDCAVNPGQDGGPLLDAGGCVVGIVSRAFSVRRWLGVAVPIGAILPRLHAFSAGRIKYRQTPLFAEPGDRYWSYWEQKFRPALVRLRVSRQYAPEILARRNWEDFRKTFANWAQLGETERRRITADFFAVDSALAANQMVRRPAGEVSGVLVSPRGHIVTSIFNIQDDDRVFVNADQARLPQTVADDMASLLADRGAEFTVRNAVNAIWVTLHDGRRARAEIVSRHPEIGMALLQIPLTDRISYLDLTLAGQAQVGEEIALLGAAPASVNVGIVSATDREHGRLFQFDAPLNYTNSGGIIISLRGRFLGVAGAPLFPQPVSGRILPFAPAVLNQPALSDFTHCPNSGIGLAVHARELAPLLSGR